MTRRPQSSTSSSGDTGRERSATADARRHLRQSLGRINHAIGRARRRLLARDLGHDVALLLLWSLVPAWLLLLVDRLLLVPRADEAIATVTIAGTPFTIGIVGLVCLAIVLAGSLAGIVIAVVRGVRRSDLEIAQTLDERLGLKNRVSTAVALINREARGGSAPAQVAGPRGAEAGRAMYDPALEGAFAAMATRDAERLADRIDVRRAIDTRLPNAFWGGLAGAVVLVPVLILMPRLDVLNREARLLARNEAAAAHERAQTAIREAVNSTRSRLAGPGTDDDPFGASDNPDGQGDDSFEEAIAGRVNDTLSRLERQLGLGSGALGAQDDLNDPLTPEGDPDRDAQDGATADRNMPADDPDEALMEAAREFDGLASELEREADRDDQVARELTERFRDLARDAPTPPADPASASPTDPGPDAPSDAAPATPASAAPSPGEQLAQEFGEALQEGDLARARDAADALGRRLDEMPPSERDAVAQRLRDMADRLEQAREEADSARRREAAQDAERLARQGVEEDTLREFAEGEMTREQLEQQLRDQGVDREAANRLAEELDQRRSRREASQEADEQTERIRRSLDDFARTVAEDEAAPREPQPQPQPPQADGKDGGQPSPAEPTQPGQAPEPRPGGDQPAGQDAAQPGERPGTATEEGEQRPGAPGEPTSGSEESREATGQREGQPGSEDPAAPGETGTPDRQESSEPRSGTGEETPPTEGAPAGTPTTPGQQGDQQPGSGQQQQQPPTGGDQQQQQQQQSEGERSTGDGQPNNPLTGQGAEQSGEQPPPDDGSAPQSATGEGQPQDEQQPGSTEGPAPGGAQTPGGTPDQRPGSEPAQSPSAAGDRAPGGQPGGDGATPPLPDESPSLEELKRAIEEAQQRQESAGRKREVSQEMRDQAQRLLDQMSPEERQELEQWAREQQREQGREPGTPPPPPSPPGASGDRSPEGAAGAESQGPEGSRPGEDAAGGAEGGRRDRGMGSAGDPGAPRGAGGAPGDGDRANEGQRRFESRNANDWLYDTEDVDLRDPDRSGNLGQTPDDDLVIAEMFNPDRAADDALGPRVVDQRAVRDRARRVAEAAERSASDQTIPLSDREFLRRWAKRLPASIERRVSNGGGGAAQPAAQPAAETPAPPTSAEPAESNGEGD